MRTTASYDLFPDAPSERAMARARWLAREGRTADAESAYLGLLASHPELKVCWAEYFELLRASGRTAAALELAERARAQFGESGFALTLEGAALVELGRYPDALAALERAVEADPDLALVWHELGWAAYKLGDKNLSYEPYGLMLRKNDQDFRQAVNTVLARLYRSGQIVQIYDRWFGKLGKPSEFIAMVYLLNALPE